MADNFNRRRPGKKPRTEDVLSDKVPVFHPHMLDLDEKNSAAVERPEINIEYVDFTRTAIEEEFVPAKRRPKKVKIPFEMTPTPRTYSDEKADAERPKRAAVQKPAQIEEDRPKENERKKEKQEVKPAVKEERKERPVKKENKKPKKPAVKKEAEVKETSDENKAKKQFKPMRAHKSKKGPSEVKAEAAGDENRSLITPYWMSKED